MTGQGWGKPRDIAEYTGTEKRSVYQWMQGGLPFSRLPSGRVLIRFSDVDDFLKQYEVMGSKDDDIVEKLLEDLEG